jgi:hypothetical protein
MTMASEQPELVSLIYEAAAIPEQWPRLLASISEMADSVGGRVVHRRNAGQSPLDVFAKSS